MNQELAEKIVDDVLENLHDRKGLGDELDRIDDDVKSEMRSELTEIVARRIKLLLFRGKSADELTRLIMEAEARS